MVFSKVPSLFQGEGTIRNRDEVKEREGEIYIYEIARKSLISPGLQNDFLLKLIYLSDIFSIS